MNGTGLTSTKRKMNPDTSNPPPFASRALEYNGPRPDSTPVKRTLSIWLRDGFWGILFTFTILIAIRLFVPVSSSSHKAKISAAQADIIAIASQMRAYEVANDRYPTTAEGLTPLVDAKLLDKIPLDPWGHPYIYRCPGKNGAGSFDLYSMGPNGQDDNGSGDDILALDNPESLQSPPVLTKRGKFNV